jgi:hypothetical protein
MQKVTFRGPKAGKSAYFTHPEFSVAKLGKKKSAQITGVNTVFNVHSLITYLFVVILIL